MLISDEHLTPHKNNEDNDYSSRGNESDGDDYGRRNDIDVTSNAEILQHRGKDYDSGSTSTSQPFVNTPQYHLIPTEEEETERRQSAKGQQLERMQRRRNARLNRQSAGVLTAKEIPGFRGEEPLENLISYIDAPVQTAAAAAARKSKKKKKKVSTTADHLDAGAEKLANSCEVFVGTSAVSTDEPSVRVGDSCCIGLSKKSDTDSLPDTVDVVTCLPDSHACLDSDNNVIITGDSNIDTNSVVVNRNAPTDFDASSKISEDLPEVVYAEVKNTVLEEENVSESLTACSSTLAGNETMAVDCEFASSFTECNINRNQTSTDVDEICVESGSVADVTDNVCSLTSENNAEDSVLASVDVSDGQQELDKILPLLTGSDSITSNTGSVEDFFVTVQKKKRSKNAIVVADDLRQRYGRRLSTKGLEDTKRSFVKSVETTSIVPSVSVSRSNIIYSKSSCSVTHRSGGKGVAAAWYSQALNQDTVISPADASKSMVSSASGVSSELESVSKCESTDSVCSSSERNHDDVSNEIKKNAFGSDSSTPNDITLVVTGVVTCSPTACDKTDSNAPFDMPTTVTGSGEISRSSNISQKSVIDILPSDRSGERAGIDTDISAANSLNVSSEPGEDQVISVCKTEGRVKSSQQPASLSTVFLDTRNIAGTTPPRSDISFGFDPGSSSPESSSSTDITISQHVSSAGVVYSPVAAASSHCPVITSLPPPVAGCPPILYFYPTMPVTILPPVATFPTGRCTPVGVVPPMPAVSEVSDVSVASPTWQSTIEDKGITVPIQQGEQNVLVNDDDTQVSDTTVLSPASSKATNQFVLYAAQRYLYSGMLAVLAISFSNLFLLGLLILYQLAVMGPRHRLSRPRLRSRPHPLRSRRRHQPARPKSRPKHLVH